MEWVPVGFRRAEHYRFGRRRPNERSRFRGHGTDGNAVSLKTHDQAGAAASAQEPVSALGHRDGASLFDAVPALASDLRNMGQSLETVVDAQDWQVFRLVSLATMAAWLLDQARSVSLRRYAKAPPRKNPPKPPVERLHNPNKPHVALSRLLAAQKGTAP